ncbi:hypothetical protein O6H91_04G002100 [Diphasiastrum complanatum]|uniref:Uncharacterized protein n=1 Tax=Diphasiastrum complanatum TaxID=34168 RepID=A0ACC2DUE5_DIPCM|nr:hypothetical protein O6H91_04G002100 [Diphasiastrum complanatum]
MCEGKWILFLLSLLCDLAEMLEQGGKTGVRDEQEEDEDFSDDYEVCVGQICFAQPYRLYVPPRYYRRIAGRLYQWKLEAEMLPSYGLNLKIERALALPNCLGLGNDARWKWQMIPLSLLMGVQINSWFVQGVPQGPHSTKKSSSISSRVCAYAKLKALTHMFGKLALRPALDLFPVPLLTIKRAFPLWRGKVTMQAQLGVGTSVHCLKGLRWMLQLNWNLPDAVKVLMQPVRNSLALRYSRRLQITEDCKAVTTVFIEPASTVVTHGIFRFSSSLPVHVKLESLKICQVFGERAKRDTPATAYAYLKASKGIGTSDVITVVPGHWIDPGGEAGAPGEREFNLEVANVLEKQLRGNGWDVLRPDRDAPHLSWEEYLNWVSKQTLRGVPVLEIHGQGSKADYRGFVLGIIGDTNIPLHKELASDFGVFQMDWRDLGVPRRGGVIVESFNSDEVMQMAPWHRIWAVRRLSNRIVSCVERASFENRASHGVYVDLESEDISTQFYK